MRRALASSAAALVRRRGLAESTWSSASIAAAACSSSLPTALFPSLPVFSRSPHLSDKMGISSEATARFGASSKAKAAAAEAAKAAKAASATPSSSSSASSKTSEEHGFVPAADDPPEGSQASDTNVYLFEVR